MAKYKRIVTTEAGLQLLAAAAAGGTVTFTALKTGSGTYSGTEDLSKVTDLKSVRQTFSVSSVTRTGTQVKLRSVFNNDNLTEGYSVTEIGLYAKAPGTGADFLYAIIVAELADYLPAYSVAPASITMELYIELTEAESGVAFTAEVIEGAYVPVESFNEHVTDNVIHITAAERSSWNAKLPTNGNASNTTATFTEATTLAALTTGSKLSVLFGTLAKAVSSLINHLVNKSNPHSVTKTQVGLGSVDNTSDADKPVSTATQTELNKKALAADLTSHTGNTSNPHGVTKAQVGLGNVPNVATNDQTPSYTAATSLTALTSGEKLSVVFGKLSKAVSDLISHLANKSNPHGVTPAQIGARVPNVPVSILNYLPVLTEVTDIREIMHMVPSGCYAFTPATYSSHIIVPDVNCVDVLIQWERQDNPNGLIYGNLLFSSMYRDDPANPIKPAIVYQSSIFNSNNYTAWKKIGEDNGLTDITSAFEGAAGVSLSNAVFKQRGNTVYFQFNASISQEISATGALVTASDYYPVVRQPVSIRYDAVSQTTASTHGITIYESVLGQALQYNTSTVISSGLSLFSGDVIFICGSYDV